MAKKLTTTLERITAEGPILLSEAAGLVPGSPSTETLARWCRLGQLEATRVGGRWLTSKPAIQRFLARCNAEAVPA